MIPKTTNLTLGVKFFTAFQALVQKFPAQEGSPPSTQILLRPDYYNEIHENYNNRKKLKRESGLSLLDQGEGRSPGIQQKHIYDEHAPGATCLTKLSGAFLKKCVHSRPSGGTKDDQIGLDSFLSIKLCHQEQILLKNIFTGCPKNLEKVQYFGYFLG